ncbi:hypothetical protein [Spirillospora sp. NPDC047279]|uniref:hypothetical protein n=1 Tax=Spirillospora sp. NPDC047279 TaxID=3155478 RepID=UPI00340338DB
MNENSGISVSGSGSIRSTTIAVGDRSTAVTNQGERADEFAGLRRELAAIIVELRGIAPGDPGLEKAVSAAEELNEELQAEEPDKNKVLQLLARLGVRVESIGNIAAAVAAVDTGFRALL